MINDEFKVKYSFLLENNLSLEAYLILVCIYNKDSKSIEQYVLKCRSIPSIIVKSLVDKGFISLAEGADISKITFKQMKLTTIGRDLFPKVEFDTLFEELKNVYPKVVRNHSGEIRRLHQDMKRAENIYKTLITSGGVINIDLHTEILSATKRMIEEKKRSNSIFYMQQLPVYLHQKNYEAYMEDSTDNISINTNIDAI